LHILLIICNFVPFFTSSGWLSRDNQGFIKAVSWRNEYFRM